MRTGSHTHLIVPITLGIPEP